MDLLGLPPAGRGSARDGTALNGRVDARVRRRGPIDRRLMEHAGKARLAFGAAGAAALVDGLLLVLAAALLADLVATAVVDRAALGDLAQRVLTLLAVFAGRALLAGVLLVLPRRVAIAAKRHLRPEVVRSGATAAHPAPTGEIVAIAGPGLDALDPYFSRYIPEMIRAATIPIAVLIALASRDLTAGLIVALTLPLIPIFGALVGAYSERRTRRQWRVLAVLSHHFLDVIRGLPTLKIFGRASAQAAMIARVTEQYRIATMSTLRVALLSALVLELAATISVALVAVSVGLRLVHGALDLRTALFLLILAPEAYMPLRRAAAEYHAAAEGIAAADQAFSVIADAPSATGTVAPYGSSPDPAAVPITLDRVTVRFPDRATPALDRLSLTIAPSQVTAIIGPSGSGKSTLLKLLLGLLTPHEGMTRVGDVELSQLDPAQWHRRLAWLPQHPRLLAGSIVDNIVIGRPDVSQNAVVAAATHAGIADLLAAEQRSAHPPEHDAAAALSAGQRQRLALARVFLRTDASLVLLDEPTAHLDLDSERRHCAALREFAPGRTVVVVTHRRALLDIADTVVEIDRPAVLAAGPPDALAVTR
jgi:thiol reductant ABC exporter CydD subunit